MRIIFLASLLAGLGIGGGLIFLREHYDSSFKSVEDLESYLDLPVMAAVPILPGPQDAIRKRLNWLMSSIFALISLTLLAGLTLMTVNGIDQALELINRII